MLILTSKIPSQSEIYLIRNSDKSNKYACLVIYKWNKFNTNDVRISWDTIKISRAFKIIIVTNPVEKHFLSTVEVLSSVLKSYVGTINSIRLSDYVETPP